MGSRDLTQDKTTGNSIHSYFLLLAIFIVYIISCMKNTLLIPYIQGKFKKMVKKKTFYVCTGFQGKHCKHHGITCYQFYIRWCATYSDAVINQKVPRLFFIGWVCWWKRFECKVPTNERGKRQDLKRVCKPLLKSKARPLLPRQSVKIKCRI